MIQVDPKAGWASINLIHGGSILPFKVSIDGHKLWVYAADGQYIEPVPVDVVPLSAGTRFQAMVKLDRGGGDWTIRVSSNDLAQVVSGYGVLQYTSSPDKACHHGNDHGLPKICGSKRYYKPPSHKAAMDYAGRLGKNKCMLDNLRDLRPYPPCAPPQSADHTLVLELPTPDPRLWTLDGLPWQPWREQATPVIIDPKPQVDNGLAIPLEVGSVVDIVFVVDDGDPAHVSLARAGTVMIAAESLCLALP